jgi:hypothetical protein
MDYDNERYENILIEMMDDCWYDDEPLEIGNDISGYPEVKIIFDGYGDLDTEEEYIEGGNKNLESYAIFIHKDALTEGFVFPEHEKTFWALIHRPKVEVWITAWHDVEEDTWEFSQLDDRIDEDTTMTEDDVMVILEGLKDRYRLVIPE